jgi:hypothetical protein
MTYLDGIDWAAAQQANQDLTALALVEYDVVEYAALPVNHSVFI